MQSLKFYAVAKIVASFKQNNFTPHRLKSSGEPMARRRERSGLAARLDIVR
jgi:hypothetical protein